MTDDQTIDVYDSQVASYTELVKPREPDQHLAGFISRMPQNALVLDLGCGPGHDSAMMREHGLRVDPLDASAEMVRHANETYAIGARQALFGDVVERDHYDGIWANFSLLHATAEEFPNLLLALQRALKTAGVFHLGMKTGTGAKRDKLGRYYSYYTEESLQQHLQAAGFQIEQTTPGEGVGLAGDVEAWIMITSTRP